MVTLEDIGRPIGRAYTYYRNHPEIFHTVNTGLIYLGMHSLSALAHNYGNHDLEKILDAGNILATGSYAYHAVNRLLPQSLRGDILKAAIVGLMAYAGLEESRKIVHGYDAQTLAQKMLEGIPFIWRTYQAGDLAKGSLASLGYGAMRILRGIAQGVRRAHPHP